MQFHRLCARHRITPDGKNRSTTVELLVEHSPVRRRESPAIGVQIALGERGLQALAREAEVTWEPSARLWKMPLRTAVALVLKDRVRKPQERYRYGFRIYPEWLYLFILG